MKKKTATNNIVLEDKEMEVLIRTLIQKANKNGISMNQLNKSITKMWREEIQDDAKKEQKPLNKDEEIFSDNLSEEEILFRLFHEHEVRVIKESEYFFGCRCNREKLLNTLSAMSEDDINEMVENGKITATCGFCGEKYYFEKGELIKH